MKAKKSKRSPATTALARGRQDGITSLVGNATFSGGTVSISLQIPPEGGSESGTSDFKAGGASGTMVPASAINKTASWSGTTPDVLTCSTLPKATFGADYAVAITYTFNSAPRTLTGVVRGTKVVDDTAPPVTLS